MSSLSPPPSTAYDLLYDTKRRRSYDSIDPTFDDAIPSQSAVSRENFFSMFGPIFLENARWSFNQPVPQLGTDEASLEEVEAFYDFWSVILIWNFSSSVIHLYLKGLRLYCQLSSELDAF